MGLVPGLGHASAASRPLAARLLSLEHRKLLWRQANRAREAGRRAWTWSLSPQGKASFAGVAAALMVLSGIPGQFVAPMRAGGRAQQSDPANTTATVPPYVLPVSEYPTPDGVPGGGNFTSPQLATVDVGGSPSYVILSGGDSYLPQERLNASLRIAGTKGNAVNLSLLANGVAVDWALDLRSPGPPNVVHLLAPLLPLNENLHLVGTYLPGYAGKGVGDNPANLSLNLSGVANQTGAFQHNFNVQHASTYVWDLNLSALLAPALNASGVNVGPSGTRLYLRTGTYSSTLAQEIAEGSVPNCGRSCPIPHTPLLWSSPQPVPGFDFPIVGDALVANGSTLVATASDGAATTVAMSADGGANWTVLGSVAGGSPKASLGPGGLLLTTSTSRGELATVFGPHGPTGPGVNLGPGRDAAPLWNSAFMGVLMTGTFPTAGGPPVAGVGCFVSSDGGASFSLVSPSTNRTIAGGLALASTDPIFNAIGQTRLDTPGGDPGQLAAVAAGSQVLALFTTSVGGETVPEVASTSNGCASWTAASVAPVPGGGSARDPQLFEGLDGYVYASWRENGLGAWSVDQAIYTLGGGVLQPAQRLPGSASAAMSAPSMAVDPFDRPLFSWSTTSSGGSSGHFTGAFLSPRAAVSALAQQASQLKSPDFKLRSGAQLPSLLQAISSVSSAINGSSYLIAVQDTLALYPRATNVTLMPIGTTFCALNTSSCTSTSPPSAPEWIVNLTGVLAANQFLAVYADLLLEALGVGLLSPPPGDVSVSTPLASVSAIVSIVNPLTARLEISWSFTQSTSGSFRNETKSFPGPPLLMCTGLVGHENVTHPITYNLIVRAGPTNSATISTYSGTAAAVYLTDLPPGTATPWSVSTTGNYVTTEFDDYLTDVRGLCDAVSVPSKVSPAPSASAPPLNGTVEATLSMQPGVLPGSSPAIPSLVQLHSTPVPGMSVVSLQWNNSMPAYVNPGPNLTGPGGPYGPVGSFGDSPLAPYPPASSSEGFWFTGPRAGAPWYSTLDTTVRVTTSNGTEPQNTGSVPVIKAGGPSFLPPQSTSQSCSFVVLPGPSVLSLSHTLDAQGTENISWTANTPINGTVIWGEYGSPSTQAISGVPGTYLGNGNWSFSVELRGLSDFTRFNVSVYNVRMDSSCAVALSEATLEFETPSQFPLGHMDNPYDSITQEGGGEEISWSLPLWFVSASTFVGGDLLYFPTNQTSSPVHVPITALPSIAGHPEDFVENLTGLNASWNYTVSLALNFTAPGGGAVNATSFPSLAFTYLKDTSGDGLSNAEKTHGWEVTYTDVNGNLVNEVSAANVNAYATNGLTSDLVEKRFGLNASRIDTAGSHMLDTWNLTFALGGGAGNVSVPSPGFELWFENSTFHPFAYAEYPGAAPPSVPSSDPGNFSGPTSTGPDSSPWASSVLWSSSDLPVLEGLISSQNVGWLRGVMGSYQGQATLTVWGKLSWGANPLAASTPEDHLADGARVNPVHEEFLQLYMPWAVPSTDSSAYPCSALAQGDGFAVRFYVNETSAAGPSEYHAFSSQGVNPYNGNCGPYPAKGSPTSVDGYTLVAPVVQTVQVQHVDLQLIANISDCESNHNCANASGPFEQLPIGPSNQPGNANGVCPLTQTLSVDMFSPPYAPFSSGSPAPLHFDGDANYSLPGFCSNAPGAAENGLYAVGHLSAGATAVSAGLKAPTYLWVPSDNSTLSNLPLGLQRYTGEQDFVLVAVNFTTASRQACGCSLTSSPVPEPWGNPAYAPTYSLTVGQGLVNILVPRGAFFTSPLGESILLNHTVNNSNTFGSPLLGPGDAGALLNTSNPHGASLGDLECYWQDRAIQSGSFPPGSTPCLLNGQRIAGFTPQTLSGYASVQVIADQQASLCAGNGTANCAAGGVPSNPSLEPSDVSAPALQAVLTLNASISSQAELDALLASLLDNTTGGLNGSLVDVTGELPTLGLNAVVTAALANETWASSGVFGDPISIATTTFVALGGGTHPSFSFSFLSIFLGLWNTVSGAVLSGLILAARAVEGLLTTLWNAAVAAVRYLEAIGHALARFAESVVAATVSALKAVGGALVQLLGAVLQFILHELRQVLAEILSPIVSGFKTLVRDYSQPIFDALNTTDPLGDAVFPPLLQTVLAIAGGVTVGLAVGFGILQVLSLGSASAISFVLPIVLSVAFSLFASSSGGSTAFVAGLLGFSGTAFLSLAFGAVGSSANSTANSSGKPFGPNALTTMDHELGLIRGSLSLAASFLGACKALGASLCGGRTTGPLAKVGRLYAAAISVTMTILSAILISAVLLTSYAPEQMGGLLGGVAALLALGLVSIGLSQSLRALNSVGLNGPLNQERLILFFIVAFQAIIFFAALIQLVATLAALG